MTVDLPIAASPTVAATRRLSDTASLLLEKKKMTGRASIALRTVIVVRLEK